MKLFHLTLITLIFFSTTVHASDGKKIKVAISIGTEKHYNELLNRQKIDIGKITNVASENFTPGLVYLVILKQALDKGGVVANFDFIVVPNQKRADVLVKTGDVVISNFLSFLTLQTDDSYISSSVMLSRTLTKGVYGLPSNKALMKVKSFEDLKAFKGVLASSWFNDIQTLKNNGVTQVELVPNYKNIFTRIAYRETDYTLLDFPNYTSPNNKELTRYHSGLQLVAVPNISIEIEGNRHFFISKKHPDGERIFTALEKGLKIMKDEGTIKKYFQQINLIRNDLAHFKVLNENK